MKINSEISFNPNLRVAPLGVIAMEGAKELGDTGRLVVRPSGTEPLIRIMTEGEDDILTEAIANQVAQKIEEKLKQY